MRSFLICVLFHLLFSDGILPRSGKLYTPEDLDWRDPKLNDFEEIVGEPFFDPYSEQESSSSEDLEEPVGDLQISMNERTSHIMDKDDPIEYAVGDFLPTDQDDSDPPPELTDVDVDQLYDDPDEVELSMIVEDSLEEEPVGSSSPSSEELDELAKLFYDDSEEDEDAVGSSDEFPFFDLDDDLENWDDGLEDSISSEDSSSWDDSEEDSVGSEDSLSWDDSEEDSVSSEDSVSGDDSEEDSVGIEDSVSWDDSGEDSIGSEDSVSWDDSEEDSVESWDDSSEESVGSEDSDDYHSLNSNQVEFLEVLLKQDSDDFEEDEVADYSEDDDGLEGLQDSEEEEVGDFIETAVGDFVDDSVDYADEDLSDSEERVGESDLLSEEYDSSDLLPESLANEESSSDESFDSEAEELVGSGMPDGLFEKQVVTGDEDGLDSEEYAVGETPDYLHESEDQSSEYSLDDSDDGLESLESSDSDYLDGAHQIFDDMSDDSLFEEIEVGDDEVSYDDDDDDDDHDDEDDVGEVYDFMDELFDEDPVGDIGPLPPFYEEEEPVGMLDANGWAILDAPPYTPARNLESRHKQRRSADGWDRDERDQEPVSEDEEGEDNDLSSEERSYRNHRRGNPHARRGRLQREYRPRHSRQSRRNERERVTTYLDDAEEAVGNAKDMLDEIDRITSNLDLPDFLSEDDIEDLRRRLQYKGGNTGPSTSDDMSDMTVEDHLHAIHNLHEVHKRLIQLKHQHDMAEQKKASGASQSEESSEDDGKDAGKAPMLIVHTHHIPNQGMVQIQTQAKDSATNKAIHEKLHDFVMKDHEEEARMREEAMRKISQKEAEKAALMRRMEDKKRKDAEELENLRKQLSDYKQKLAGKDKEDEEAKERLRAKLLAMKEKNDAEKEKEEERRRREEEEKRKQEDQEKKDSQDEEKQQKKDSQDEENQKKKDAKDEEARKKKEEARKKKETDKNQEEDEKRKQEEGDKKKRNQDKEDQEKDAKRKELEKQKAEARRKIDEMKEAIKRKKQMKLQEARDQLVKELKDQLKELKEKSAYRKKMREKGRAERDEKKEEDKESEEKRKERERQEKEAEKEKEKESDEKRKERERREKEQDKLTEEKKKAMLQKIKEEKERKKKKALLAAKEKYADSKARSLARQRLQDKRMRDLYRHKSADFHLDRIANQFPFVRHFFGHTGNLEEKCGATKCRCGFYKINWQYKKHCYMVEGDCQRCDAPDSQKVKAIGFTYKYIEEVKKRLPIFTYRRRGKQWHKEPKEKSVCPKGKIVTGVRTMVTKTKDNHKHSMKIQCGPGSGKPETREEERNKEKEARKKEEDAKKKYDQDEEDAQKPTDDNKDNNDDQAQVTDDPSKCLSKGKACSCGFNSVTFTQAANGCFIPGGDCNECGSTNLKAAVQAVGFDYVFNDQAKKEFPKFIVRKKGSEWTEPTKQFQCKSGYVVNGVWTSAEKDVTAGANKRDQYYLSITCRKAEYSEEEKKDPKTTMSAQEEEQKDQDDQDNKNKDDNNGGDADGPVQQHECPPAVSECKCGFSFVAWRKTQDCYQLQGECLECGTPGAVNAIGYNYKFDKDRRKSVYRWRYRTEGKLWSQPERRYSCREGKIVTNIATSAVRSGDEVKYHLWMKCNDAIPTTPKVALNGMVAWFKYAGWDGTTWKSTVGNYSMSVLGGQIATKTERGDGAENGVWQVQGTTDTQVSFGDIIARDYTICSLSRYTGPQNQRRILVGTSGNWLHGHWSAQAGVAIYGTWVTRSVNRVEPNTNWLFQCGQNAQRSIIRANGMSIKKANGGIKGPMKLQINKGGCCEREASNWAVAEIMTWGRFLTFTELIHVEAYLKRVLKAGNLDQRPQTTAEVAVFMSQPALTPPAANPLQVAVAEISTTQRALSLENAPKLKPKFDLPNVLGFESQVKSEPVKLNMEKDIQQAVSEAFDNIHIDNSFDDDFEIALADSNEPTRHHYRSAAQRTEENLMRTQLGLAKVGGLLNFNVVLLALLVFGVVAITASCVYFSKEQGDSVDAYYDSLANELHALE